MSFRVPAALAASALLLAVSAPASAEDFAVPIELPKGATIDLMIEKALGETRGGVAGPVAKATFRYRQTVTPQGDGFRVRQVMTDAAFPAGARPTGAESQVLAAASDISYLADESLAPVALLDWEATIDRMMAVIAKADPEAPREALDATRKMFAGMGPDLGAEVLLKEQNVLAATQMRGLDKGEPLEQAQQVPNPLGGPPIDSIYRVELVGLDETAGRATIRSTQTLDPVSAGRSMKAAMERMMKQMGKSDAAPSDFHMDRSLVCAYDMDLKTGLTARVECDMKASFTAAGETGGRTERTVITQTLVSQP